MADNVVVQVVGVEELRRAIGQSSGSFEKRAMQTANAKAAGIVAALAVPQVPVRSGRLRSSIRALATAKKGNVRAGSTLAPYAAAIHWGRKQHGVIKARPFLWNAKNEALHSGVLERTYADACQDVIDQFF